MGDFKLALLVLFSIFNQGKAQLSVNVQPKTQTHPKGSNIFIDCATSGTTKPVTVTWSFGGLTVENIEEQGVFPNNTLYIKNFKKSQKGAYVCKASDGDSSKSATAEIQYAFLKKIPLMKDRVEFQNQQVTIICPESKGFPIPDVRWEHNGKVLPATTRYTVDGRSLAIAGVKLEDSGNFTCVVNNSVGVQRQSMHLQVHVPGTNVITPKFQKVLEKKRATFQCKSKALPPFPSKEFKWVKDNKDVVGSDRVVISPDDGTLTFKSVEVSDNGTYACKISMVSSSTTRLDFKDECSLQVQRLLKFDPTKLRDTQNLDRKSTRVHSVSCAYIGDEPISVTWKRKGVATLPSNMRPVGNSLVIDDPQLSDGGEYECFATGPYNSINTTIKVVVFEGVEFTKKPTNLTVAEGESGQTSCEGRGKPMPKITWAKAETNSDLPKNFRVVKNKTLLINSAEASNGGTYFCMIANGQTSSNVEFQVVITRSKKKPQKSQQSMGRTVGIAVGCAGAYIVLVIGLMIYCRSRRSRLLKRQGNIATEIEDGEFNKDLLDNGDEEYPLNGDLRHLDKWSFPRENLSKVQILGNGKYGEVYTAKASGICEGEVFVAVKQLPKGNEQARKEFDQELEMLTQLQSENIVKLLGVCVKDFPLLMITEYSEHGDLKQFLSSKEGAIGLPAKLSMCSQIAKAMEYLSANGIIHHDLACRNCVVMSEDCHLKVAFFSISEDLYVDDYCLYNDAHVPLRWLSPEALFKEEYSEKSGVWAFGVVMWEIYNDCKRPYPGKSDEDVVKFLKKKNQLDASDNMPKPLIKLMKNCVRINPDERPKFADMVSEIEGIPSDSSV